LEHHAVTASAPNQNLSIESEPKPEDIALLETRINEFNVQATRIDDGKYLGSFLRDPDGTTVGGLFGWTWGATCYIRYLFVPVHRRSQGLGRQLMQAAEAEARARGCHQILLETHSFQAPQFYRKLGFEIVGTVERYPTGHRQLTMLKQLNPL
jgi:GNAT superfamily N-acetyltransferase